MPQYRAIVGLVFCVATATAAPRPGSVTLQPAKVQAEDGTTVAFEAGTLYVAENRAAATSNVIEVRFARLKAARPSGAPPVIFLPGGPGNSYLEAFTATTPNARRRLAMFRKYAATTDLVVLDQRGFSPGGTMLATPAPVPQLLDRPSTTTTAAATWTTFARGLPTANPGRDLAGYNLVECAADVDELRRALGYAKVSLLGGSFGSQWSFAVMRLYSAAVARAVLYGVEPLDAGFDMPSHELAAIQRIAFEADRAPALQPYLPPGGLMAALTALRDRFARGPIHVRVTDPTTRAPVSLTLGLEDLQGWLIPVEAEDWPAFVLALYHGHYEDWALQELAARRASPFSAAIIPLIDSGIGASAQRVHAIRTDPATALLGTWDFAPHIASRSAWPTPDLGDALRTPVSSTIPVLFLNGDWDVSTPIENMLAIAPYFPAGRTMIVHRGSHDQASYLTRQSPEAFAAILEFLRTGSLAHVPSEITLTSPTWKVPAFPPPPR
jgi:pimeloyl-ACP methyl ester carboxylesterase